MISLTAISRPHTHSFIPIESGSSSTPNVMTSPLKSSSRNSPTIVGSCALTTNCPIPNSLMNSALTLA